MKLRIEQAAGRAARSLAAPRRDGWVLLRSGRVDQALAAFSQKLRDDPRNAAAAHGRAEALRRSGRRRAWLEEFERAIRLNRFRELKHDLPRSVVEEFLRDVEPLLAAEPGDRLGRLWRGVFRLASNRFQEARDDLDFVLSKFGPDAWALACRAQALARLGDAAGALRDLDASLRLDPSNSMTYAWRAMYRLQRAGWRPAQQDATGRLPPPAPPDKPGRLERAVVAAAFSDFRRSLRLDSLNSTTCLWRARLRLQRGHWRRALSDLDHSLNVRRLEFWRLWAQGAEETEPHGAYLLRSGLRLLTGDCAGGWRDLMRCYRISPRFMAEYAEAEEASRAPAADRAAPSAGEFHGIHAGLLLRRLDSVLAGPSAPACAWAWRGVLRRRHADYPGAVQDFDRAWRAGLRSAMLLTWRGEARLQAGDPGGMRDLERAARPPCQSWNHAWAGRALVAFQRSERALEHFDAAIRMDPGNGWYYAWRAEARRLLRKPEGMFADFERALSLDPGYRYQGWVRTWRGMACVQEGRHEEALAEFDRALAEMPGYPLALNGRQQALRALRRRREWIECFDLAARLDAKYVDRQYSLSMADVEALVADLDALLREEPDCIPAFRWRGLFQLLAGRLPAAAADLDRALAVDPADAWALAWRGQLRCQSGDLERGTGDLTGSLRAAPGNAVVLAWRAKCLLQQGKVRAAAADLDEALKVDQRFAPAFYDRGCLRLMSDDARGAVEDLDRAATLDRRFAEALATLGLARGRRGDAAGERRALEGACRMAPQRTRVCLQAWAAHWAGQGRALSVLHRKALERTEGPEVRRETPGDRPLLAEA